MNVDIVISGFSEEDLSAGAIKRLEQSSEILLHTEKCYLSQWLRDRGISYASFDELYEEASDFDALTSKAVEAVKSRERCAFCVMDSSDETAKALIAEDSGIRVYGGGTFASLELRSKGKYAVVNAVEATHAFLSPLCSTLIKEIDSRLLAGDVKLVLEEVYGEQASVFFRMPEGNVVNLPLSNLDRLKHYDHRCACLINPSENPRIIDFDGLKLISESNDVKDACLNEETLAQKLACVVQSITTAQGRGLFAQSEVFERAAEIITKGE